MDREQSGQFTQAGEDVTALDSLDKPDEPWHEKKTAEIDINKERRAMMCQMIDETSYPDKQKAKEKERISVLPDDQVAAEYRKMYREQERMRGDRSERMRAALRDYVTRRTADPVLRNRKMYMIDKMDEPSLERAYQDFLQALQDERDAEILQLGEPQALDSVDIREATETLSLESPVAGESERNWRKRVDLAKSIRREMVSSFARLLREAILDKVNQILFKTKADTKNIVAEEDLELLDEESKGVERSLSTAEIERLRLKFKDNIPKLTDKEIDVFGLSDKDLVAWYDEQMIEDDRRELRRLATESIDAEKSLQQYLERTERMNDRELANEILRFNAEKKVQQIEQKVDELTGKMIAETKAAFESFIRDDLLALRQSMKEGNYGLVIGYSFDNALSRFLRRTDQGISDETKTSFGEAVVLYRKTDTEMIAALSARALDALEGSPDDGDNQIH